MQEQDEESGPTDPHDLILRGTRVIDPSQNLDRVDAVDLARRNATAFFVDACTAGART